MVVGAVHVREMVTPEGAQKSWWRWLLVWDAWYGLMTRGGGGTYKTTVMWSHKPPHLLTDGRAVLQIDPSFNGFAYVCDGSGKIGGTKGSREQNLVLGPGDHLTATTSDPAGLRFLLVAGKPIEEPIVQHGPFVMNTQGTGVLV